MSILTIDNSNIALFANVSPKVETSHGVLLSHSKAGMMDKVLIKLIAFTYKHPC